MKIHFSHSRAVAELSARALQKNYHSIQDQVSKQFMLPMIKANAYGHDLVWAGKMLLGLQSLYGFGVATLEEGAALRTGLGAAGKRTRILVFSGTAPWNDQKGQYCERFGLTPVIATDSDWKAFYQGAWCERLAYHIKFNTGMNRLGVTHSRAAEIVRTLKSKPAIWHPQGVLSHLALGESPEHRLSQLQRGRFEALRGEFESAFSSTLFHLANSSAIWNQKHWRLSGLTDLVRPGLSLYGVPPWKGAPERGIQPVMRFWATVLSTHALQPGESLGYGASFTVPKKPGTVPVKVAIVGAGYADGVLRQLSNQGHAWLNGRATRFLGRVSMDMSAVEAKTEVRAGDEVEILGPRVDYWAQAEAAKTIPYELLTSVSGRVQRRYVS